MAEVVRVAALTGYLGTMESFGVDPRALLREIGLAPALLANPEQLIPARAAIRLLERSAETTGCMTFGLRMAEGRALADLGATSLLIAYQPTLRHALAALGEFRERINSTLTLHIEEAEGYAILREDFSLSRPEPCRQACNLALGVLAHTCVTMLGEGWTPQTVCFSHEPPPVGELAIFRRLFRCAPEFGCEFNGIVIDRADLDRPNVKGDAALAGHARQLLESAMSPGSQGMLQQVEQLIKLLLPSGRATIQTCAASLGLTVRTLQRMLDAEGQTFSGVLDRARMQLAEQYLANSRMRITDIADLLGYSSIGAFTRWYGQTFGMSPRERRKSGQSAGGPDA